MPYFKYKGRNTEGKAVEGLLEADSEGDLSQKLSRIDILLIEAAPDRSSQPVFFRLGKVKRREVIIFTNHMATSLEAGISVIQALTDYADESLDPRFKRTVEDLQRQILAGTSLSEAMSKHPGAFSEMYVSIVSTGEATGKLDAVLKDLVGFLEWQEDLASQVTQASIYPIFLVSMIIGVITLLMTFTIPKFIPIFKNFQIDLPTPTVILMGVSGFFQAWWWVIVLLIIAFIVFYHMSYRTPKGRFFWDGVKLQLPVFGALNQKIILSKFAHYLSMLYSSGIGIIESFSIIQAVVGNEVIRRAVGRSGSAVEKGSTIFESLKNEKYFPPLVMRMIQVGEKTGNLDKSLQKVSQYYDKEIPASIKKMFAVFEPMLIITLGGVVLFIALAILLSVYKMTSTIGAQK